MTGQDPAPRIERLDAPLDPADRDAIVVLQNDAFTNQWTPATVDGLLASVASQLYVARGPEGGVVAFCACYVIADEVHINTLAVGRTHRRQGVASALLATILRETGALRATLEVRRSNESALALYAGFGFQVTAVRPDYYENPDEDALILWLNP